MANSPYPHDPLDGTGVLQDRLFNALQASLRPGSLSMIWTSGAVQDNARNSHGWSLKDGFAKDQTQGAVRADGSISHLDHYNSHLGVRLETRCITFSPTKSLLTTVIVRGIYV